jgi:predicted deacylase
LWVSKKMVRDLMIAGGSVSRGEMTYHELPVVTLTSGRELRLGVHVLNGKRPGPKLTLIGTIHGDEPLAADIFSRILSETNPEELSGSLIVIPVANPLALETMKRNTPLDMLDLNRNFPGKMDGWLTEKIANVIAENIIKQSDYVIDFHTAPPFLTVDYCFAVEGSNKTAAEVWRLVRAFGQRYVYLGRGYLGSLTNYALSIGIPSFATEIGGESHENDAYVTTTISRVKRTMAELGMIKAVTMSTRRQVVFTDEAYRVIRPTHGGVLYPNRDVCRIGARIAKGGELGKVVSPHTFKVLETISSPFSESVILLFRRRSVVIPGDYSFIVGDMSAASTVGG